jgi:hypothetical protein
MLYGLLADLVMLIHLGFVLFVIGGGFMLLKWPWIAWFHLPAAAWGALVELTGWICPLTPLENRLLAHGGTAGYKDDFLIHYVTPVLYPTQLTRPVQVTLGIIVITVNVALYGWIFVRRQRGIRRHSSLRGTRQDDVC